MNNNNTITIDYDSDETIEIYEPSNSEEKYEIASTKEKIITFKEEIQKIKDRYSQMNHQLILNFLKVDYLNNIIDDILKNEKIYNYKKFYCVSPMENMGNGFFSMIIIYIIEKYFPTVKKIKLIPSCSNIHILTDLNQNEYDFYIIHYYDYKNSHFIVFLISLKNNYIYTINSSYKTKPNKHIIQTLTDMFHFQFRSIVCEQQSNNIDCFYFSTMYLMILSIKLKIVPKKEEFKMIREIISKQQRPIIPTLIEIWKPFIMNICNYILVDAKTKFIKQNETFN